MDLEALWAKLLKGIYFHKEDFLNARQGRRTFRTWSSLLVGRNFLKKHLLWQVMDGEKISICNDNWVLGLEGNRIGHPGLQGSYILENVGEIIVHRSGEWNLGVIEHWLS